MCLGTPVSERQLSRIKKEAQKRGYIRIYKVVGVETDHFHPPLMPKPSYYKYGVQKAVNFNSVLLDAGWHGFRNKKSAEQWLEDSKVMDLSEVTIECLAKPEWIIDAGIYKRPLPFPMSKSMPAMETIRLTRLCFPKFPKTKVTVREFRKLCKSKNI